MDQFDAIAVDDDEAAWFSQKDLALIPVGGQQTLQAREMRQSAEVPIEIPLEPAVEGPKAAAFERKQHPNRHQFTRRLLGWECLGRLASDYLSHKTQR